MLGIILVQFRTISIFKENITLKVVLEELELFWFKSTDYKKKQKNTAKENFVGLVTQLISLFLSPCWGMCAWFSAAL